MGVHRLYSGKQSGSGTKMLKLTLAACLLLAAVEGSYYGYGGYDGYGYGGYGNYAPHSYAPYYPRYGYSDYNTYPYVTATHAAYSHPSHASYPTAASYPTPSRYGYSSGSYGNVGYGTPTGYLYNRAPGYGLQGEVDTHYAPRVQGYAPANSHYAPNTYAPHYPRYY